MEDSDTLSSDLVEISLCIFDFNLEKGKEPPIDCLHCPVTPRTVLISGTFDFTRDVRGGVQAYNICATVYCVNACEICSKCHVFENAGRS